MRSWGRYVILGSLCPSFRAKGAPLQGDPWPFLPGPISRPPPAHHTSRSLRTKKNEPKTTLIFEWLLDLQMLPKASQNDVPNPQQIIEKSIAFSIELLIRFCTDFCLFLHPPDPRFNCCLQRFRGVQHFSRTWESTKTRLQKSFQKDTKINAKSI